MPRLLESQDRADDVTAAVNHVLTTKGAWALTYRQIAKAAGLSPSSLTHQFGDREHLLRVCAHRTGKLRMSRIEYWLGFSRVGAFLPDDAESVELERAWQQWIALARGIDWLEGTVDHHRTTERRLLGNALRLERDDPRVTAVRAFLDGLCLGICDGLRPLDPREARKLLDRHLAGITNV